VEDTLVVDMVDQVDIPVGTLEEDFDIVVDILVQALVIIFLVQAVL